MLFNRATKVMPSGVNSPVRFHPPYPFFAKSGSGSKIITVDHKTYIDYCMGYGALLLGHSYKPIMELVKSQLDEGNIYCIPTEKEVELAEVLSEVYPSAEMTRLVNTGMEATMIAIRLARAFTKKKKVIMLQGCYHGAHDYCLVESMPNTTQGVSGSEGTLNDIASQTLVVSYNDNLGLQQLIKNNDDIACLIVEPVAANMGLVLPEKEYLNQVRKATQQNNIILIFDEVVTGFRLALGGASEFFGIRPDLVTFAKAMGSGFPIAAVCGKKDIMQLLAPAGKVYQASTYGGNPLSVTASLKTLDILRDAKNEIYPHIAKACDNLVDGIKDTLEDLKLNPFSINSIGSMYQLFFTSEYVKDFRSAQKSNIPLFRQFFKELLKRDIFVPPSQFESCFISYKHIEDDIDKTVEAYGEALREVKNYCV